MATKKNVEEKIFVPKPDLKAVTLHIVGDTPLICHAWSQKAKQMMLSKQMKKATAGREARRPAVEFADSLYWLTEKPQLEDLTDEEAQGVLNKVIPVSKFGFPVLAFKSSAVDAGYQQKLLPNKTTARGAFHIAGEFAEIEGTPTFREDMTRIDGGRTAQIAFRAEFKTWATTLFIKVNTRALSIEEVVNLFNFGGFANGVGDWRPARDGNYGTFHVE